VSRASQIIGYAQSHQGGTFDAFTGNPIFKDEGYFVSEEGAELVVDNLTEEVVEKYIQDHRLFLYGGDERSFLGIWHHNGGWYIDCSSWWKSELMARHFGFLHSQLAIWDCKNDKEIIL